MLVACSAKRFANEPGAHQNPRVCRESIGVSVVVPCYNSQRTIRRCLDALDNQTIARAEYEVIVVDSSRDETPNIVESEYPSVTIVHQDSRLFPGVARNLGVQAARGELIAEVKSATVILFSLYGIGMISVLNLCRSVVSPVSMYLQEYSLLSLEQPNAPISVFRSRLVKRILSGWTSANKALKGIRLAAISETLRRRLVKGGITQDIVVVYPGLPATMIDCHTAWYPRSTNGPVHFLYSGHLVPDKGVHTLISATGHLANQLGYHNWRLHIAGGNSPESYMQELLSRVQAEGLQQYVEFHGWLGQDELSQMYQRCDVLVVPSIWDEPFGTVAVEGMGRGLPVVASRVGGLQEIICDGFDAFLFPAGDTEALAQILASLVDCQKGLSVLRKNARQTVKKRFNVEKNALLLLDLIAPSNQGTDRKDLL